MEKQTRMVLIGVATGVSSMVVMALMVFLLLNLHRKWKHKEDDRILHARRHNIHSRQRQDSSRSGVTQNSRRSDHTNNSAPSDRSIPRAYNRRSFSTQNGNLIGPQQDMYERDPTLQPLHNGFNDPFHKREGKQEGTMGGRTPHQVGSPGVVPFRQTNLPSATSVLYSSDGRILTPGRDKENNNNFFYGENKPIGGRLDATFLTNIARASERARARAEAPAKNELVKRQSSLPDEVYERRWEEGRRIYSSGRLWSLNPDEAHPIPHSVPGRSSSGEEASGKGRRKRSKKHHRGSIETPPESPTRPHAIQEPPNFDELHRMGLPRIYSPNSHQIAGLDPAQLVYY